jgi:hypothetical protein
LVACTLKERGMNKWEVKVDSHRTEDSFFMSLDMGEYGLKKSPERGSRKIDPWDGKWKREEDFYFPRLGDDSQTFLFFLLTGEGP